MNAVAMASAIRIAAGRYLRLCGFIESPVHTCEVSKIRFSYHNAIRGLNNRVGCRWLSLWHGAPGRYVEQYNEPAREYNQLVGTNSRPAPQHELIRARSNPHE